MGRVVGIDLGTTNTAVAVLVDGKPKVLEDERGYKVLPSCVSAKGDGRFIVGHAAHNLIITRPGRTVYATKRLIGRRFDSPEVTEARNRMQYQIREAPDGLVQAQVGDAWMSPTEIAAIILQVVKSIAERGLGDGVDSAVITVPAYFNHQQRQATLDAAQLAGLRCERLLNEPTAAALAYGFKKTAEKTILVFDLGGGTFDVSVLRIGDGLYETLSTVGDTYLGGEDFDFRLVDYLADNFKQKHGIDLRNDKHTLQRLKDAAERAKCELSFSERTTISVPHVTPTANLEVTVTRNNLEQITADLVARCVEVTRKAVVEAGIELREVEEVVLVGGQSRMPRLREAVTGLFGKEPSRSVHPEEAVAVGAAIYAAGLDDPEQPGAVLLDVTPFDLGIDSAGGMFTPVIERNSRVPGQQGRSFVTARDGQDVVKIVVRQGNSRVASENEFLGEFLMTGLTRAPRFQTKVEVTFRLDSNGILHVTAVEKGTGEKKQIIIRNYAQRATDAKMPSPEEAAADRERRAKEEVGAETIAPVAVSAGTKKKAGFFDSLFGAKSKTPKAAKATPEAKAPVALPPEEAPAAIDLSAVAAPIQMPPLPTPEPEAPPPPPPSSRPVAIGLAGEGSAVDPFATPVEAEAFDGFDGDIQELSGLDADDLFGGLVDETDDSQAIPEEEVPDGSFGFLEEPEPAKGGFGDLDARFQ
ncbi:MAG TPA: Hsp70 family protein, partial [Myxococcota bacterium]|nr:Hsp70 family protein [Myxococcota bacterium]